MCWTIQHESCHHDKCTGLLSRFSVKHKSIDGVFYTFQLNQMLVTSWKSSFNAQMLADLSIIWFEFIWWFLWIANTFLNRKVCTSSVLCAWHKSEQIQYAIIAISITISILNHSQYICTWNTQIWFNQSYDDWSYENFDWSGGIIKKKVAIDAITSQFQ